MGSLALHARGRSAVLRRNWSNAYPVWVAANALLEGEAFDVLDEDTAPRKPSEEPPPVRDGPTPLLHIYDCPTAEAADWLAQVVTEDLARGIDPGDCAVLAPSRGPLRALERALTSAAVPFRRLERYEGEHADAVCLGTFHRAKGLEFKRVFVFGLDAATWPPKVAGLSDEAQAALRARWLRAAFVAMTRAGYRSSSQASRPLRSCEPNAKCSKNFARDPERPRDTSPLRSVVGCAPCRILEALAEQGVVERIRSRQAYPLPTERRRSRTPRSVTQAHIRRFT